MNPMTAADEVVERLRRIIRQHVDPFEVAPEDHALVLAIGTDDEAGFERLTRPTVEDGPLVERVARQALFGVELARVNHVQPVNGDFDYFYVSFAGSRIIFKLPFHDEGVDCCRGPLGPEIAALSDKAAKTATAINDLLFALAKDAARAAIAALKPSVEEMEAVRRVKELVATLDLGEGINVTDCRELADDLRTLLER